MKDLEKTFGIVPESDCDFLRLERMSDETNALKNLANVQEYCEIYGIDSSKRTGIPITDPETLDVDLSVVLALNWDEDAIVLDYRNNLENPRVLWLVWSSSNQDRTRWIEIAGSFQEFALKLNLQ